MLFNTLEFFVFFVLVAPATWALRRVPVRNALLLAASYVFYGAWDVRFLTLIVGSTLVDYFAALTIERHRGTTRARLAVTVSVATNLGLLGVFKYYDFFLGSLAPLGIRGPFLEIAVPVGISFYTFQTMSYSIDVYRGRLPPTRSLLDFALYVAFFPQLVAGPIERATHLLPQITSLRRFDPRALESGLRLVLWGLIQKCVVADNLAVHVVDPIFDPAADVGGWVIAVGVYAFAFQILGDFAGYSNIAIGCARILGFDLRKNFDGPYLATDPSDFWRRWHISLSTWLRDYLYIELGGNRTGHTARNLMLTMLLGGLWHGASWKFVLWGAFHGVLLALFRVEAFAHAWAKISRELRVALFFQLTCMGWLIFRANDLGDLVHKIERFTSDFFVTYDPQLLYLRWTLVCVAPLLVVAIARRIAKGRDLPAPVRGAAYALGLYLFLTLGEFGSREFIYFQF
ncbi:MAG: MBOAT family O-acyltransferase [Deltaproteobacteria bacterium]